MMPQRNQEKDNNSSSIWFEIWGVVDPGKKNRFLQANFRKISISSGNFTKKFRFFQANFRKISISQEILKRFRISRQKLAIYSYFLANYSIYLQKSPLSNILPVHDKM